MNDAEQWNRLHDGDTYKVYDTREFPFRYTVTEPTGGVCTVTITRWGARFAIARRKRKAARGRGDAFWTKPLVDEVPKD
ncbi:hypothetical protein [Micromonospora sp. C41]|uniref:hypothetical protein n=1 Tax=Micromonospora sp. C41 TaxID=2824878 RepID=UPI001B3729EE|nr:hypothetical protein [Micromonospora sp. C41]MBQ1064492.1 hypothetical protein [Micromonospora sp. C41]